MDAQQIIDEHGLEPNPYGGWYRQTYSNATCLGERPIATVILYLLTIEDASCMPHRTGADCIHFFHEGSSIAIRTVDPDENIRCAVLGPDRSTGQELQIIVPGSSWKEFRLLEGEYGFMSEAVIPGYISTDDELADPVEFHSRYSEDWMIPRNSIQVRDINSITAALDLQQNIEGGYYRQTYQSVAQIRTKHGLRSLANTIYYLLTADSPIGHFHLNRSDITHFFHFGGPIEYLLVSPDGDLQRITMGKNRKRGEVLSFTCPAGWWKSSHLSEGVNRGLISELTSPGFCKQDHEIADLKEFAMRFPHLFDTCRDYIAQ